MLLPFCMCAYTGLLVPRQSTQGASKEYNNSALYQQGAYSCLVPIGRALLLLVEAGILLSLAVVPLQPLIDHHLQAAMLLSHLRPATMQLNVV